jgi:hypothetical protein
MQLGVDLLRRNCLWIEEPTISRLRQEQPTTATMPDQVHCVARCVRRREAGSLRSESQETLSLYTCARVSQSAGSILVGRLENACLAVCTHLVRGEENTWDGCCRLYRLHMSMIAWPARAASSFPRAVRSGSQGRSAFDTQCESTASSRSPCRRTMTANGLLCSIYSASC